MEAEEHPSSNTQPSLRKRFSVWSDVLLEQELSEDLKSLVKIQTSFLKNPLGNKRKKSKKNRAKVIRRDVETYVIPGKSVDEDGKPEKRVRPGNKKSTKRLKKKEKHEKKASGKISKNKKKKLKQIAKQNTLVMEMATTLKEPRVDLLHKVIQVIGEPMTRRIYGQAIDVEATGGLLTSNGSRRRTAGGVFFHLVKHDKGVTQQHIEAIWAEDILRQEKKKKLNKKAKKRFESLSKGLESFNLQCQGKGSNEVSIDQVTQEEKENEKLDVFKIDEPVPLEEGQIKGDSDDDDL